MLYYPFISPPRPVILQALLYWDGLSSIVPMSDIDRPELRQLGAFYTPFRIDDELGNTEIPALVNELHAVLDQLPRDRLKPDDGPLTGYNRLYYGKLPSQIEDELREMGAVEDVDGMMKGASEFLLPMLAVTAKHIADACNRRSMGSSLTVTNTAAAFSYHDAYAPIRSAGTETCWLLDVGRLLPIPRDDVPIEEVIAFRNDSDEARGNLTRAVRSILARLRSEVDEPSIPIEFRASMKAALDDYTKARAARRWSWVRTAATAVIGLGASAAAHFVATPAADVLQPHSELGIAFGAKDLRKGPDPNFTYLYNLNKRYGSP
jgi:hypothetical protein